MNSGCYLRPLKLLFCPHCTVMTMYSLFIQCSVWHALGLTLPSLFLLSDALDALGLKRYCCRRMLLSHVDLIEKLLNYAPLEKWLKQAAPIWILWLWHGHIHVVIWMCLHQVKIFFVNLYFVHRMMMYFFIFLLKLWTDIVAFITGLSG